MKMKEVCQKTGLSERTIRFYAEKELVCPPGKIINGWEYRDYKEQDIAELLIIADLRRAFFPIEEIRSMKENPCSIPLILEKYLQNLREETGKKQAILSVLNGTSYFPDIFALGKKLKNISSGLSLPAIDINPDFGRMDGESKTEKEHAYQDYLDRQEKRLKTGKQIVFAIALFNVLFPLFSFILDPNLPEFFT